MKLHDLRPAPGSHTKKRRVGRGIAAGQGKTAGRGTKGQKARAGGSIPARFEGGQTPLHVRIPKLRGFKNKFKVEYEIVNLGAIGHLVELGAFEAGDAPGAKKKSTSAPAPITINQELLRAVGLVRTLNKPLKVLGTGEIGAPLFVVADAFSRTAVAKIEAAGGSVSVLEFPTSPMAAIGLTDAPAPIDVAVADLPVKPAKSTKARPASATKPAKAITATKATAAKAGAAKVDVVEPDALIAAEAEAEAEAVAEVETQASATDAVDDTDTTEA